MSVNSKWQNYIKIHNLSIAEYSILLFPIWNKWKHHFRNIFQAISNLIISENLNPWTWWSQNHIMKNKNDLKSATIHNWWYRIMCNHCFFFKSQTVLMITFHVTQEFLPKRFFILKCLHSTHLSNFLIDIFIDLAVPQTHLDKTTWHN